MANKIQVQLDFTNKVLNLIGIGILSNEQYIASIKHEQTDTVFYQNAGFTTSDFTSPDINVSTNKLDIDLPLNSSSEILQGKYLITWKQLFTGNKAPTIISSWFYYCPALPDINISLTYDCRLATITSRDITEYKYRDLQTNTVVEASSSTTKDHTLSYPNTLEVPKADITQDQDNPQYAVIVAELWTKVYVSRVTSNLIFDIPSPVKSTNIDYQIIGTISGIRDENVVCSDCLCSMFACMHQLFTAYMNSVSTEPVAARRYEVLLMRLNALYMLYQIAERCGEEDKLRNICGQIQAIINLSGLACCTEDSTSDYSILIQAYGVGSGSGGSVISGTVWFSGAGVPSSATGNNGDFYLSTDTYKVYKKVDGSWAEQFTMEFSGTFGNRLIDVSESLVSTDTDAYKVLYTYSFDSDLVANGSVLELSIPIAVLDTDKDTKLKFSFLGNSLNDTIIPVDFLAGSGELLDCKFRLTIGESASVLYVVLINVSIGTIMGTVTESKLPSGGIELLTTGNSITVSGYGVSGVVGALIKAITVLNHKQEIIIE